MKLSIAGQSFTVTSASLFADIINPARPPQYSINGVLRSGLSWRLSIEVRNEWISFYHEDLLVPNVKKWTDLAGQVISWDEPINSITGEPNGGWYGGSLLGGHLAVFRATLQFTEVEKTHLHLTWEGLCEGATSKERLPFLIDCRVTFEGIDAAGWDNDGKALLQTIAQVLEPSDFVHNPDYKSGEPLFIPRE